MSFRADYGIEFLKKHNGIHIEHIDAGYKKEFQTSKSALLIYIAHSNGVFYTRFESREVYEGDILLINSDTDICFKSTDKSKVLSIYSCAFLMSALTYKPSQLKDDFPELIDFFNGNKPYLHIMDSEHFAIRNIMVKMIDDFIYAKRGYEQILRNLLSVVLINFFRMHTEQSMSKNEGNFLVGIATQYAKKNMHSKIPLREIADILHITPQHLCRVFKKHNGMTISEFVNRLRVERIKYELENTERPIYVIYEDYDLSPQYISRMFKKHTGYGLQEYKNKFNYKGTAQ